MGHGDSFVTRDPWGIRPASYYFDDEIVVVASERAVIQTAMDVKVNQVQELKPGHALIIKKDGRITEELVRVPQERRSCSFERIYFSRGSDKSIYAERKKLGELLAKTILQKVDHDLEHTVFSYIPNTAETSFFGMMEGVRKELDQTKIKQILDLGDKVTPEDLDRILSVEPRVEKIAIKDVKMRTFIADDNSRDSYNFV